MKLEMTLPARPGFLHMLPGLDIIALILMFPLLGPSFVQQTGIDVQVHESPWRYEQMDNPIVVTLGAAVGDRVVPVWVNKNEISLAGLETAIEALRSEDGGDTITTVVIRSDVSVPSGIEKEVVNRVIKLGLRCGLVGKPVGKSR
ncbi:MAG: biopolymer transporter ExbD [Akkermansiaceae bacterium]|nr:biopolymer transporter ExbD [Akkermansiaceae bacterium]